jgi:cytochrome c556
LRAVLPLVLIGLIGLVGCAAPEQTRYERELERTDAVAAHAVHNDRLQQVMRRLGRLEAERLPKALDVSGARQRQVEEVVRISHAMAESAAQIPEIASGIEMDESTREEMVRRSRALQERCLALAREAPELPLDEMRARLESIDRSCNGCHERFRPPPDHPS